MGVDKDVDAISFDSAAGIFCYVNMAIDDNFCSKRNDTFVNRNGTARRWPCAGGSVVSAVRSTANAARTVVRDLEYTKVISTLGGTAGRLTARGTAA